MAELTPFDFQSAWHERLTSGELRRGTAAATQGGWLLLYTIEGGGEYRYGETWFSVGPGDLFLLRRDHTIALRVPTTPIWDYVRVRFGEVPGWTPPSGMDRVSEGHFRAAVANEATRQRIADAGTRMVADASALDEIGVVESFRSETSDVSTESARRSRAIELIRNALLEIFLLVDQDRGAKRRLDPRVRQTMDLMERDLAARHTLASLAHAANLSPSRLGHLFVVETGLSPIAALQAMRLRQAARRLRETDDPVGAIATETGFGSNFHFSRQFRRHYGTSPRAYRASQRA